MQEEGEGAQWDKGKVANSTTGKRVIKMEGMICDEEFGSSFAKGAV